MILRNRWFVSLGWAICTRLKLPKPLFKLKRGTHFFASVGCPRRWTPCVFPTHLHEDVFGWKWKCRHPSVMSYSITRWNNPIIFRWHRETLGDACKTLGKTDSLLLNTACPSRVFLGMWSERVRLEMRVHNWEKQVTGEWAKDKSGEKPQHIKRRKKCLRNLLGSGSNGLCMFPRYDESGQRAVAGNGGQGARSKWQGGRRRGAEVDRAQTGARGQRIKQEKRHEDQDEGSS